MENSKDCPSSSRLPNASRRPHRKTRLQYPKFWQRGGPQLKLRRDLDGCPLHFWPPERRDGKLVPRCMKMMQTKETLKPFLDTLRRQEMIDL